MTLLDTKDSSTLIELLEGPGQLLVGELANKTRLLLLKKLRAGDASEKSRRDNQYRKRAHALFHDEGNIEVDEEAVVSPSKEGAYVQGWLWVEKL